MKNFILSLIACIASFALTTFGLNKYSDVILSKDTKEETKVEVVNNNDSPATDLEEEEPDNTNEEGETEINEEETKEDYIVTANISDLEKNVKKWKKYNHENIELSYEFTPVDVDDNIIEKEYFLDKLKTGLYIPLKVDSDEFIYKLHKLSDDADKKIGKSIRSSSSIAYSYYKKEGQPLPEFDFTDLDGNKYNKTTTKGKIKVIKCWFINCVVCVQEFPELNELYDRYESNEDVMFMSLAFDKPDKLKQFLSKKEFRYPVIPEQKSYMTKKLGVKQYPTHIIVDEDNTIIKVVNNVEALTTTIDQLIGSDGFDMNGNDDELEIQ